MQNATPGQEKLALNEEFKKLHAKLVLIAEWKKKLTTHYPVFNHTKYLNYIANVAKGNSSAEHRLVEACKFIVNKYYIVEPQNI